MGKIASVTMRISVNLAKLIKAEQLKLNIELRSMGINKNISPTVASEVIAKKFKNRK